MTDEQFLDLMIPKLVASGTPLGEIARYYPGIVRDALLEAFCAGRLSEKGMLDYYYGEKEGEQ